MHTHTHTLSLIHTFKLVSPHTPHACSLAPVTNGFVRLCRNGLYLPQGRGKLIRAQLPHVLGFNAPRCQYLLHCILNLSCRVAVCVVVAQRKAGQASVSVRVRAIFVR